MNTEALVRCTYWLGRARALAAMSDMQEVTEILDKAVDSLCEAMQPSRSPPARAQEPITYDCSAPEWSE